MVVLEVFVVVFRKVLAVFSGSCGFLTVLLEMFSVGFGLFW